MRVPSLVRIQRRPRQSCGVPLRRRRCSPRTDGSALADDPDDGRAPSGPPRRPGSRRSTSAADALLHDVGHQLGAVGLVEEVDRAAGETRSCSSATSSAQSRTQNRLTLNAKTLFSRLTGTRSVARSIWRTVSRPASTYFGTATLGAVDAGLRAVDREQLAGLESRADQLRAGARATADLEDVVGGLDVHDVDRPADAGGIVCSAMGTACHSPASASVTHPSVGTRRAGRCRTIGWAP